MGEVLNEEQIADFKEAFSLFDKDSDGVIDISQLGLLIRSLNQNPTNEEIKQWTKEVDPQNTGKIDFPEFISLMARKIKDVDRQEELLDAFKALEDKEQTGLILAQEFQYLMTTSGEVLTEAECKQLIKEADPDNTGSIRYAEFVKLLTTRYIN